MKARLVQAWQSRGWLACVLWPVSLVYGLMVHMRRLLYRLGVYRAERFDRPIIVVGNAVAGGAGKTPLVMALVDHLHSRGVIVGVVSRGYGRSGDATLEVTAQTPPQQSGDEPALIRRNTGAAVFVARRRADAVRALLAARPGTQVVVCDDGLQHLALARDMEIAVFDDRGVGNGWLLPAGPLREPWPRRGRTVDMVLHTGRHPAFGGFTSTRQLADHAVAADGQRIALDTLRDLPPASLAALAGIANPGSFFAMLRERGLSPGQLIAFDDHDDFQQSQEVPETRLAVLMGQPGLTVLCTEKDAIKLFALPDFSGLRLLAVPLLFAPEPAFFATLDAGLARWLPQPGQQVD